MLNSYVNSITPFSGNIFDNDVVRASIDTIARHFAKMKPEHRLKNSAVNSTLNRLLDLRPNPLMSTYDFLYKTVTQLYVNNNAYIYVRRDDIGNVLALYPVEYSKASLSKDSHGDMYLSFTFVDGNNISVSIDDIIVLRRHYFNNDFYGEANNTALYPAVNLLCTINQGTINAVKSSAYLRGILSVSGMIQEDDRVKKRDSFTKEYLTAQNNGGIAVTDDTSTYTPIDNKPLIVDDASSKSAKETIYKYYGISEEIITSSYSDTEWQAFYESVLEPLAIQFSQEFTQKLFTQRELEFGNKIVFIADRLSYLSTDSKVKMFTALKELGVVNKGTTAEIFNLPIPPDADKYLQSLNYINAEIADKYQLEGGDDEDDENTTR